MSQTIGTYTGLITAEHNQKPNFMATVALSCQGYVDAQNLVSGMYLDFDIDEAVGAQLDVVGQWIGQSRQVEEPITGVYFSLDVAGLGLDQGYLQGPYDPTSGLVSLDDATYRLLLYAKRANNNWPGTTAAANAVLADLFNNSTTPGALVWEQDNQNATIFFILAGQLPSALFIALFADGYLDLVPAGVGATYYVGSVMDGPAFGLDMENSYVSGLDVGALVVPA